jgi:hypothetical protein
MFDDCVVIGDGQFYPTQPKNQLIWCQGKF